MPAGRFHSVLPPDEVEDLDRRVAEGLARVCGPRRLERTFTTLLAVARRPEASG